MILAAIPDKRSHVLPESRLSTLQGLVANRDEEPLVLDVRRTAIVERYREDDTRDAIDIIYTEYYV